MESCVSKHPENWDDLVLNLYLHHCKHSSFPRKVAAECPALKHCFANIKNITANIIFVPAPCQPGQRSFPMIPAGTIFCWKFCGYSSLCINSVPFSACFELFLALSAPSLLCPAEAHLEHHF